MRRSAECVVWPDTVAPWLRICNRQRPRSPLHRAAASAVAAVGQPGHDDAAAARILLAGPGRDAVSLDQAIKSAARCWPVRSISSPSLQKPATQAFRARHTGRGAALFSDAAGRDSHVGRTSAAPLMLWLTS